MLNPLQIDPTRTITTRRAARAAMAGRFRWLRARITELVDTLDAFGLRGKSGIRLNVDAREWQFLTDTAKLEAFKQWLQEQIDAGFIRLDPETGRRWFDEFIDKAYAKGHARAFTDAGGAKHVDPPIFGVAAKQQFMRELQTNLQLLDKVGLLYLRSFERLKGMTDDMAAQVTAVLADGLARGHSPRKIARTLTRVVDGIESRRALKLATTEIIHAHAEGQLDAFERLGVNRVTVLAEVITAGDERVCPKCRRLAADGPYTIAAARGLIPAHPQCRCAWGPVVVATKRTRLFAGS